jgi:MYXO-CTERM domain-containing protein
MTSNAVGTAANPITTINLRSGTLRNVGDINGGGAIAKTTAGTLVFDGANAYTGPLTIAEGVLDVNGAGALGATGSTSTITVEDLGQLALNAAAIPDGIGLGINSNGMGPTAEVVLDFTGTDTLATLTINGIPVGPGEYGASGTGAANNADLVLLGINPDDIFSGTGTLTTTSAVPEPGALGALAVAALGMLRRRRAR